MQINNINNNTPSFRARVHIGGRKNTVPKEILHEIKFKAKKIGRRQDLITLYFGKPMSEEFTSKFGNSKSIVQKYRRIFSLSNINGVEEKKDLSYCVFDQDIDDSKVILENVTAFLKDTALKARKAYSPKN